MRYNNIQVNLVVRLRVVKIHLMIPLHRYIYTYIRTPHRNLEELVGRVALGSPEVARSLGVCHGTHDARICSACHIFHAFPRPHACLQAHNSRHARSSSSSSSSRTHTHTCMHGDSPQSICTVRLATPIYVHNDYILTHMRVRPQEYTCARTQIHKLLSPPSLSHTHTYCTKSIRNERNKQSI